MLRSPRDPAEAGLLAKVSEHLERNDIFVEVVAVVAGGLERLGESDRYSLAKIGGSIDESASPDLRQADVLEDAAIEQSVAAVGRVHVVRRQRRDIDVVAAFVECVRGLVRPLDSVQAAAVVVHYAGEGVRGLLPAVEISKVGAGR